MSQILYRSFGLILLLSLQLTSHVLRAQDYYMLRGYVLNEANQGIPGVSIRVQNSGLGTVSNTKGQYELRLEQGLNRIVFSSMGYKEVQVDMVMDADKVKNIWMEIDDVALEGVSVGSRKKDFSYTVIRKLIEHKDSFRRQYQSIKAEVYVKSVEELINRNKEEGETVRYLDQQDSIPSMNLFEGRFIVHRQGKGYLEEKLAAERHGSQHSLFYTSLTDGDFDFYDNIFTVKRLGDNSFVSPFSTTAFINYRYRLLKTYFIDGRKIYRIQVIPKRFGNALFKGVVEVYDGIWALKSLSLEFPEKLLLSYDAFKVDIEYGFVDSVHLSLEKRVEWTNRTSSTRWKGHAFARYSHIVLDTIYGRRFFGDALGTTAQDAYEKDTSYWSQIRPVPLTVDEQRFIRYKDSIHLMRNSKVYLDSIDSVYNRITWQKVLYKGIGHINRTEKEEWGFSPVLGLLDPLAIGGWRVRYSLSYYKRFENRRSVFVAPFLNYGFLNRDVKGNLHFSTLYDPMRRSRISFDMGKYFGFVNNFATISDLFKQNNFYERTYISLDHRTELFNGFYLSVGADHTLREDMGDFRFGSTWDSLYANDDALRFPNSSQFRTTFSISYTPHQLYILEPREKVILGSRYPTFNLSYSQAWPGVFGSSNKYQYIQLSAQQAFNIGVQGSSEYRISTGKFLDTTDLSVMDYRYIRGGDPYWFTPAMYTYQLIPETFTSFDWFAQIHYLHQFNGFLIGRIPGFKHLGIRSMAGAGFLYVPEHQYEYSEIYYGINRIFKIGRERMRIGVYHVMAQSNQFGLRSGIKFSFQFYDPDNNSWTF